MALPAQWWRALHQIDSERLRSALDPDEVPGILKRISTLADAAAARNADAILTPGIEAIARIAQDLRRLLVADGSVRAARRGDVRERHRAALAATVGSEGSEAKAEIVGNIVGEAAGLGCSEDQGHTRWLIPENEAIEQAAAFVSMRLRALGIECTRLGDSQGRAALALAFDEYRKPRARTGRPRKGCDYSTDASRAEALAPVLQALGIEASDRLTRTLQEKRKERRERVSTLAGK